MDSTTSPQHPPPDAPHSPRLGQSGLNRQAAPPPNAVDEAREAEEVVFGLVIQYALEDEDRPGVYHSGCLTAMADAMRWLAARGRVEMLRDGPGRNVMVKFPR